MALILEVVDESGVSIRHRLSSLPLTLGRGLSNDLVLDDPYVDAHHARIVMDESGAMVVEDLGSINRLVSVATNGERWDRLPVGPGAEIRIGRTVLRFRDTNAPVPPALFDGDAGAAAPDAAAGRLAGIGQRGRAARIAHWVTHSTPGRLIVFAAAGAAVALSEYLGSHQRSSASGVFTAAIGVAILLAMWAGMWAIASRIVVHRFRFVGHLAVASAAALLSLTYVSASEWFSFFMPETVISEVLGFLFLVGLSAALLAGHLSLASTMTPWRRWRAGLMVSGAILLFAVLSELLEDDSFSDVPSFSGVLKPVGQQWLPTRSVDEFGAVMLRLRDEVDELAER